MTNPRSSADSRVEDPVVIPRSRPHYKDAIIVVQYVVFETNIIKTENDIQYISTTGVVPTL